MASLRVALASRALAIRASGIALTAVPSMDHPDFREVLEHGWVSPPSFGPSGDLRVFSAAHTAPGETRYAWFASADWRRGRIQIDRRGAISDIAIEPYGSGRGKLGSEPAKVVLDYGRRSLSITIDDSHSAIGRWTDDSLSLEVDADAGQSVDAAVGAALFLWCTRPEEFRIAARAPFS